MANLIRRPSSSLGLSTFEEFDKLFDDLWQMPGSLGNILRMPSIDIYSEDDQHMVVEMQAPGFDEDDIDISVRNGVLEIRGETSSGNEEGRKRSYMMRESRASFARRLVLPEGANEDNITAELDKGILRIVVPVEQPEARRISITSRGGSSKRIEPDNKR